MSIFILTFVAWIVGGHVPMTSGKSVAASTISMTDVIKRTDDMSKPKVPLSLMIERFKSKHGEKYDYSLVNDENYKTRRSRIPVICPKHGVFEICIENHLVGDGCHWCKNEKVGVALRGIPQLNKRSTIYGVGVNDYEGAIRSNGVLLYAYGCWQKMIERCYREGYFIKAPTYKGCSVCDEWHYFSNFKKWFDENYVDGYALDKDILVKGNKVYSPQTCCFVPTEINTLLVKKNATRGKYPIGVSMNYGKYRAQIKKYGKAVVIGTFDTPEEAFKAYKQAKEAHIQEVATQYFNEGKITEKVYNALMNYKVEITD